MNANRASGGLTSLRKTLITLVTVMALVMATIFAVQHAPAAGAQETETSEATAVESESAEPSVPASPKVGADSKVNITDITITAAENAVKRPDGNLYQNQPVRVEVQWEAIGQVKQGDTFTLQFPKFFPLSAAIEAKLVDEKSGLDGGSCVLTDQFTLTCTFNDNFKNKDQVRGTVTFQGQPGVNESGEVDITIIDGPGAQPQTKTVQMPRVLPDLKRTPDSQFRKAAEIQPDGKTIEWEIWIPYGKFADADEIVITDELTGSHKYNGAYNAIQYGENWTSDDAYRLPDASIDAKLEDQKATITIPKPAGGWKEGWDLRFWYQTTYTGEGLPAFGTTFSNEAKAFDETAKATATYTAAIAGTIVGVDRGSFELTKELEGEGDCREDISGQEFTVEVTLNVKNSVNPRFDFPGTREAKAVKGAKGTEGADGVITYTDKLVVGTVLKGYDSLPKNSTITIREIQPPRVDNVKWSAARWKVNGKEHEGDDVTVTIAGEMAENVDITIINPFTCDRPTPPTAPSEPSTPSSPVPSEPSTPSSPVPSEPTTPSSPAPSEPTTPKSPEGSSDAAWLLLLVPLIPAVMWFLGKDGAPKPAPAPEDKPAPEQKPAPEDKPAPTTDQPAPGQKPAPEDKPAPATDQPAPEQKPAPQSAKPGERKEIKSVPSGATALTDGIARFVA